jgi:hypothetical protein
MKTIFNVTPRGPSLLVIGLAPLVKSCPLYEFGLAYNNNYVGWYPFWETTKVCSYILLVEKRRETQTIYFFVSTFYNKNTHILSCS